MTYIELGDTEQETQDYKEYLDNTNEVYTIFKDYFGEERTDLQQLPKEIYENSSTRAALIIIHFPEFTITNEFDETHIIKDMYVRISVKEDKTIGANIEGQRSTLTDKEYASYYCHSHLPSGFGCWEKFCLGKGPIKDTLLSLIDHGSEDLWLLFCGELEEFLKVESLAGGPYIKISNISNSANSDSPYNFKHLYNISNADIDQKERDMIKDFLRYFLTTVPLKYYIIYDKIELAMDVKEFTVLLSNAFFNYYNTVLVRSMENWSIEELINKNIINPIKKVHNNIVASGVVTLSNKFDTTILFKNELIQGKIIKTNSLSDNIYGVSDTFMNIIYSLIYNYTNCCINFDFAKYERIYYL